METANPIPLFYTKTKTENGGQNQELKYQLSLQPQGKSFTLDTREVADSTARLGTKPRLHTQEHKLPGKSPDWLAFQW